MRPVVQQVLEKLGVSVWTEQPKNKKKSSALTSKYRLFFDNGLPATKQPTSSESPWYLKTQQEQDTVIPSAESKQLSQVQLPKWALLINLTWACHHLWTYSSTDLGNARLEFLESVSSSSKSDNEGLCRPCRKIIPSLRSKKQRRSWLKILSFKTTSKRLRW